MNRYPVWKYAILVVALLVAIIYALPNVFGEAPAVQVSSSRSAIKVDLTTVTRVEEALKSASITPDAVALDGTSLTVNEVSGTRFGINIIPHTLTMTTWGAKKPGDPINLEIDQFARYMARLLEFRS